MSHRPRQISPRPQRHGQMVAAPIIAWISRIGQPHHTRHTGLEFEPLCPGAVEIDTQLRRLQSRTDQSLVVDAEPLHQETPVVPVVGVPGHIAGITGQHDGDTLPAADRPEPVRHPAGARIVALIGRVVVIAPSLDAVPF
nr:hypothetical protein [Bradyrhizobium sp. SRS-191]